MSAKPAALKIVNLEPEGYAKDALQILESLGTVSHTLGPCDVLIVRLARKIDGKVMDAAKGLKIILTATTGLTHIDEAEAEKRGIEILSLRGETEFLSTVHATAEHTMGLMLALLRHIPAAVCDVAEGRWNRDAFKGHELAGKTLGVVGCGRLGGKVAGYAKAFGMHVLAADIKPVDVKQVVLDELLMQSDIVSLHVPYDKATHHLLGRGKMALMKKGSYLINTSRGEVIDEAALLENLKSGHIAGAALDVLSGENSGQKDWMKNDPLIAYAAENSNLIITPHTGGATFESMEKTEIFMAKKLKNWVGG